MEDIKKPHPLSKEARKAREKAKSEIQEQPDLSNQNQSSNIETQTESVQQTSNEEQKEASIPLSQVEDLVNKMMESKMAQIQASTTAPPPVQQIIQQVPVYTPKSEHDIDDIPEFENWVMKDREYALCDGSRPITCSIPRVHSDAIPLQYTNKTTQKVYPMRWSTNQPSFFMEKQSTTPGSVIVSDIVFDYGRLKVPADNVNLQKFLHIHQYNGILFEEFDPNAKSRKAVEYRKLKKEAEDYLFEINSEVVNRAIAGVLCENYVPSWELDNLQEQLIAQIDLNKDAEKSGAQRFVDLSTDPTIKMRGIIKTALAKGDLIYVNYRWLNRNREVLIEVAKNQDEMEEMVKYLESGLGRTFYDFLQNC